MRTRLITGTLLTPKFSLHFGLIIAVLMLAGCEKAAEQQGGGFPPPAVSVAQTIQRDITPWAEFNGHVEAKESVQVRPRVGGVIEEIHYREGDTVKRGDLLFVLDQKPFRAELNRAEAELARARAQANLARAEIRRAKNLLGRNLLSQDEYDQRIAAETQANATVRSAEATLEIARLNLEYTNIRSPITGRTGRALVTKGNLVSASPTPDLLATIFSFDPIYVAFDSDELTYLRFFKSTLNSSSPNAQPKRTVYVALGNEQGFPREGYVDFIDNQVSANTGTIRLRAVLDNKDQQLIPGMFTRVKLLAPKPEATLLIADHAILTDQDRKYVYILGEENKAVRRDITTGRIDNGLRVVHSGLTANDSVIVHGIQKIFFPNMPVVPQKIGMSDPAPAPGAMPAADH